MNLTECVCVCVWGVFGCLYLILCMRVNGTHRHFPLLKWLLIDKKQKKKKGKKREESLNRSEQRHKKWALHIRHGGCAGKLRADSSRKSWKSSCTTITIATTINDNDIDINSHAVDAKVLRSSGRDLFSGLKLHPPARPFHSISLRPPS